MDYPFFVRKLCAVSNKSLHALNAYAESAQCSQHRGFTQPVTVIVEFDKALLMAVVRQVSPLMLGLRLRQAEILVLSPGSEIKEHSDLAASGAVPWQAAHTHKVMVPVQMNEGCESRHRRSQSVAWTVTNMEVGYAYLYNDYVWHSGHNLGTETRYLLALSYDDPELRVAKILTADLVEA